MYERGIGDKRFYRKSLKPDKILAQSSLDTWTSRPTQEKKNTRMKGNILAGSGQIPLAKTYPELANIMMTIFDSGEGFQSHPRLICETLYIKLTI